MLTKHLPSNKILDIRLEEEKFYFPGETIKEKETTTLFRNSVELPIYPEANNSSTTAHSDKKSVTTLEAKEHSFPFQFTVPKNLNLPSSMEFGKKTHIRYMINALLDRPMIPESLCPRMEYYVHLLEFIDIEQAQFKISQERCQDMMLPKAKYNEKCMVRASIPRLGFTRGDIIPVKVLVDHFTSCHRKNSILVDLVRTVEIRTSKHTVFKESILRTTCYDLNIKENEGKQQLILCQLLIPTSTPPSIRYKDKVVRFLYKVRVTVSFTSNKNTSCVLDLPFVIGTWPRAAIPIDDDDDEADEEEGNEDDTQHSLKKQQHRNSVMSSYTADDAYNFVNRSDSVNSKKSHNSLSSSALPTPPPIRMENDVPTHILEPISNHQQEPSQLQQPSIVEEECHDSDVLSESSSSLEDSDEDDEDDLLAIIERKKKKERKELRNKRKEQRLLQQQKS
ncbi:hypothetical protein BDF20DRAFT_818293 [Mycotypha africana]|uniref:uncharacterized protein n=1 Tax=Mycotypha africana TaxID=64632 RepID=UPI002300A8AA|nr:uncharacterized protein BDF20DRAFT_818293 [Mycotypha africana]KAI8981880.1 hypothetical protein BDF20DRAFT_818293 [Mycotypha africana]